MHPAIHSWRRVAATTVVAVALACIVAVSAAAAAPKRPPCTKRTIAAGLRRGTAKTPGAIIEGFQCDGRWAFAVDVDKGITVPALLRAKGTRWVSVNRVEPCKKHAVPKKIYFNACIAS